MLHARTDQDATAAARDDDRGVLLLEVGEVRLDLELVRRVSELGLVDARKSSPRSGRGAPGPLRRPRPTRRRSPAARRLHDGPRRRSCCRPRSRSRTRRAPGRSRRGTRSGRRPRSLEVARDCLVTDLSIVDRPELRARDERGADVEGHHSFTRRSATRRRMTSCPELARAAGDGNLHAPMMAYDRPAAEITERTERESPLYVARPLNRLAPQDSRLEATGSCQSSQRHGESHRTPNTPKRPFRCVRCVRWLNQIS